MPINFNNADTLNRVQRLFDNPTGWADRVISMLNTAFGGENVFGTAATRDTGTAGGEVPVVNADGNLAEVIGAATASRIGIATLADLETASDARQVVGDAIDTVGGSALGVRHAVRTRISGVQADGFISRITFSDRPSLVLVSAAGGNAPISGDIFGIVRMQSVVLMPTATGSTSRIHINSGRPPLIVDGVIDRNSRNTEYRNLDGTAADTSGDTMQFLSAAQLSAFNLEWGFRLRRFGAGAGEKYASTNARQNRYIFRDFSERREADLLIAYKRGASTMFYETNTTDRGSFVSTSWPFDSNSSGQSAGADGFAVEILL